MTELSVDLSYVEDRFGDGECGPFAQALHSLTDLPLVLFRIDGRDYGPSTPDHFPRHAAVRLADDAFLDAFGIRTLRQVSEAFDMRLKLDLCPDPARYPFESGPGQQYYDASDFSDVASHALAMLFAKGLATLVSDEKFAMVLEADEQGVLSELEVPIQGDVRFRDADRRATVPPCHSVKR